MKKTQIIAEIGQAHDGSLGILHSLVDAVSSTGVDAIKFQMHIADAESSVHEPFRVKFSYVDKTRQDYWRRMEFTLQQWKEVKEHCESCGVEFMVSPFSCEAVELLEELGVKRYKIGSGEVRNLLMLERIASTRKPILLSSGMSSISDLENTINFLKQYNCDISIFQCTTQYPTSADRLGLNVIEELKRTFGVSVGFSDHSGKIYAGLAAVSLGAELLEVHATFDKRMFGPDSNSSLSISELKILAEGVRYIDEALNSPVNKNDTEVYHDTQKMFEKTLCVRRELLADSVIALDDLESKKPSGHGIPAQEFQRVIGKKLKVAKEQYEFLRDEDLV